MSLTQPCSGPDCQRTADYHHPMPLCTAHNLQWRRNGALKPLRQGSVKPLRRCSGPQCDRMVIAELCETHRAQRDRRGEMWPIGSRPTGVPKGTPNPRKGTTTSEEKRGRVVTPTAKMETLNVEVLNTISDLDRARVRRLLARHNALDLAEMLGVA